MPSRKKRVALSLPDDLDRLISELSEVQGVPKTALILDLLEESKPVLEMMLETVKAVKEKRADAFLLAQNMLVKGTGQVIENLSTGHEILKEVHDKAVANTRDDKG